MKNVNSTYPLQFEYYRLEHYNKSYKVRNSCARYYSFLAWNCCIIFMASLILDITAGIFAKNAMSTFFLLSCLPPIDYYPDFVISPDLRANFTRETASWMINVRSDLWGTTFNIYWSLITWKRSKCKKDTSDKFFLKKSALVYSSTFFFSLFKLSFIKI